MKQKETNSGIENHVKFTAVPINELTEIIRDCVRHEFNKTQLKPNDEKEELLKADAAAKFLKISKVTLFKWRQAGIIPYHRVSSRIYFKKHELVEALKSAPIRKRNHSLKVI